MSREKWRKMVKKKERERERERVNANNAKGRME
jgi:hypothetical protein